jgi:ribosome-associated heat shock protein Hsp15
MNKDDKDSLRIRIDKWLWAVRLFKTRSQASSACEQGKISINDQPAKASRMVNTGDIIRIKRTGLTRVYMVRGLTGNRVSAKLVVDYCDDLTPPDELEAYKNRSKRITIFRDPGTGRPTKRERRDLDEFMDEW